MRSLQETCERWDATFADHDNISDLRTAVLNEGGQSPCSKGIRSICWKAFLLFENLDKSTWTKTLSDSRSAYGALRDHFLKDIEHPDNISAADPLTGDDSSPWSVLRQDEALRAEILQDVERCMPENHYFREPPTQAILLDILFIYCKLNRDVGYRQGMHEVLAPMLWVISRDAIDAKDSTESSKDQPAKYELICNCLDPRFVEHDTFTLFAIIMQTVKSFYEVGTTTQAIQHPTSSNSPIVERSRHIHDVYLRQADPELADHLVAIEILPQIFLIRWIRLLFGREFPLDDVLTIWDILFAEDPTLDLVDLVCVSMLLRIRWQLIGADYSEALALLLRYPVPPPPNGPATFVADALYLRENISHGGGAHIVHKYSGRSLNEGKDGRKPKARSGKRLKHVRGPENSKTSSPARAASRLLQQQGGIDTIIQGAAMGVYSQGEKWGVNKALRGAVEGLQSAQRQVDAPRWSLDKGSHVPSESDRASEIRTLEQRSKGLAKLLENAIGELWEQQRQCSHDKEEAVANALSVAIAKVQFVQVYLENPTMPFANEHPEGRPVNAESREDVAAKDAPASEPQPVGSPASDKRPNPQQSTALDPVSSHLGMDQSPTDESGDPTDAAAEIKVPKNRPPQLPFHRPRPTLAQSSFSWMLGEDQRKSSFVSPTPVPAERRAAREKAEFLFGDGKADTGGKETGKSEDDEVINLGTLKGRKGKESLR